MTAQPSSPVAAALDAIEAQLNEMRSLKGWRLNLIRENLAKAKAALAAPAQLPASPLTAELLVDRVISPNMTDSGAMELAYGLLWMVVCDRRTKSGQALFLARKAIYERLNRSGQARGITAARNALGFDHIGDGER